MFQRDADKTIGRIKEVKEKIRRLKAFGYTISPTT